MTGPTRYATSSTTDQSRAFWQRLADNAFRRQILFLIPVLLMGFVGLFIVSQAQPEFRSTAIVSASANPLFPDQQIRGTTLDYFETPAAGTARILNEQLLTDTFTIDVAERAGLSDAIDTGLVPLGVIRQHIWAARDGNTLLSVNATWGDPQTAFNLASATVDAYLQYLSDTVATDSSTAEDFYRDQHAAAVIVAEDARGELDRYIDQIPDNSDQSSQLRVQFLVERYSDEVVKADAKVDAAQEGIDAARLAAQQSRIEAGRSVTLIDTPKVPVASESSMIKTATTVATFVILGIFISIAAILVTTVLDNSVSNPADLRAIAGVSYVGTVPRLPRLARGSPSSGSPQSASSGGAELSTDGTAASDHDKRESVAT